MFDKYFEKTVVINLDKRKDRLKRFISRITPLGASLGGTVERFSAIDGNTIPTEKRNNWSAGAAGCKQSHIDIITECRKNKVKSVLVLEDDVTFVPDFKDRFKLFMDDVPEDWDMLYLGGNHQAAPKQIKNQVHQVWVFSTHAYAIKDTLYDHILDTLAPKDEPIDVSYQRSIHDSSKWKTYGCHPQIAGQEVGHSDVEDRSVDHRPVLGDIR